MRRAWIAPFLRRQHGRSRQGRTRTFLPRVPLRRRLERNRHRRSGLPSQSSLRDDRLRSGTPAPSRSPIAGTSSTTPAPPSSTPDCPRRIFAERFDEAVLPVRSRRTARLEGLVHHLGLALGGRPAASFAKRLMLPVSNDTPRSKPPRHDVQSSSPPCRQTVRAWGGLTMSFRLRQCLPTLSRTSRRRPPG